jgi:SNF2 family DNA or RNA helicase
MQVSESNYSPSEVTYKLPYNSEIVIPNENIKLIGFTDRGFKISFKYRNKTEYLTFRCYYDNVDGYALHEKFYNSELWDYELEIRSGYYNSKIYVKILLNEEFVEQYYGNSIGLSYLILNEYKKIKQVKNPSVEELSFLTYMTRVNQPVGFKVELYPYQLQSLNKMLMIEKEQLERSITQTTLLNIGDNQIIFDPVQGCRVKKEIDIKIKSKGGILADQMGLGKTLTSLALLKSNPKILDDNIFINDTTNNYHRIISKATLLICPSHLAKQWADEAKNCLPNLKIIIIRTKRNHEKVTYDDIKNADFVIITQQFLMNFKYYPALHYGYVTASSFRFSHRNENMKSLLNKWRVKAYHSNETLDDDLDYSNLWSNQLVEWEYIKNKLGPIFEMFYFHRLFIDEGHEIFGEMLSNGSLSNYISNYLRSVKANYFWYISGTPFINRKGMVNCFDFIKLEFTTNKGNILKFDESSIRIYDFLQKENFIQKLLPQVCIRHRKSDVENQIDIPGYEEEVAWVNLTNLESKLYEAKKSKTCSKTLQQLCCHPLVAESFHNVLGNKTVSLEEIQTKLLEHHSHKIQHYTNKLENLHPGLQEYHMLKRTFTTKLSESKYILEVLKNINKKDEVKDEDDSCIICYCDIENPALTSCGHKFCYECLTDCLKINNKCPSCRADLKGSEIVLINKKEEKKKESVNPIIEKYGSKLGKIITMVRKLIIDSKTRIIIFSQWDKMLGLIGRSLAENGVANSFVKGNVWARNSAISKFKLGVNKSGEDNKVILLSLKNSASGTNLTEATHIFFVEPINGPSLESKSIEGQAIGRACRLGQKNTIKVIRVLTRNTIEEDIYNKYYLNNNTDTSIVSNNDSNIII